MGINQSLNSQSCIPCAESYRQRMQAGKPVYPSSKPNKSNGTSLNSLKLSSQQTLGQDTKSHDPISQVPNIVSQPVSPTKETVQSINMQDSLSQNKFENLQISKNRRDRSVTVRTVDSFEQKREAGYIYPNPETQSQTIQKFERVQGLNNCTEDAFQNNSKFKSPGKFDETLNFNFGHLGLQSVVLQNN